MANQRAAGDTSPRRRADAERNVDVILAAALDLIANDGDVNMAAVARAAGLSRVTLYSHFPTREALLEAAVRRAFGSVSDTLAEVPLDDAPAAEGLTRLLRSSWSRLAGYRHLYTAAVALMPPSRLREHHAPVLSGVEQLVARGQAEGDFRTNLPQDWLVTTIYTLLHQAAEEVNAGRLTSEQAGDIVTATILSVLAR